MSRASAPSRICPRALVIFTARMCPTPDVQKTGMPEHARCPMHDARAARGQKTGSKFRFKLFILLIEF